MTRGRFVHEPVIVLFSEFIAVLIALDFLKGLHCQRDVLLTGKPVLASHRNAVEIVLICVLDFYSNNVSRSQ